MAPGTRWLVTIHMPTTPAEHVYPQTHTDHRAISMPEITVGDWREHLLSVAAHEAFHLIQFQRGWSASEVEAERHARRMIARWRHAARA